MLLGGHEGEVFGVKFNPDGSILASCSHDKHIFLWRVYGECENFMVLKGHKNAVLDVHWTQDGEKLLSASPDKTVRVWDASTGEQTKKMTEHDNFVNSCYPLRRGPPLLCSGSDDGNVKVHMQLSLSNLVVALSLILTDQHLQHLNDNSFQNCKCCHIASWSVKACVDPCIATALHAV